jgi:hypothetical protein
MATTLEAALNEAMEAGDEDQLREVVDQINAQVVSTAGSPPSPVSPLGLDGMTDDGDGNEALLQSPEFDGTIPTYRPPTPRLATRDSMEAMTGLRDSMAGMDLGPALYEADVADSLQPMPDLSEAAEPASAPPTYVEAPGFGEPEPWSSDDAGQPVVQRPRIPTGDVFVPEEESRGDESPTAAAGVAQTPNSKAARPHISALANALPCGVCMFGPVASDEESSPKGGWRARAALKANKIRAKAEDAMREANNAIAGYDLGLVSRTYGRASTAHIWTCADVCVRGRGGTGARSRWPRRPRVTCSAKLLQG